MTRLGPMAMVLAGLTGTLLTPPAQAAEPKSQEVVGGWVGELPCLFMSATPSASAPTIMPFECVSGSTWDGSWVGHTVYRLVGTLDAVTGDFHATIDETLAGLISATGAPGTLHLMGTVDSDGPSATIVVCERLVGGTGAFATSSGTLVFEGFQAAAIAGHGGYQGTWTHR